MQELYFRIDTNADKDLISRYSEYGLPGDYRVACHYFAQHY